MKKLIFVITLMFPAYASANDFSIKDIKLTGTLEVEYGHTMRDTNHSVVSVLGLKIEREDGNNTLYLAPHIKYDIGGSWSLGPEVLIPLFSKRTRYTQTLLKAELKIPY